MVTDDRGAAQAAPSAFPPPDAPGVAAGSLQRAAIGRWRLGAAWLGVLVLVLVIGIAGEAWCGVAYLSGLYGSLGSGVLPALLAVSALVASLTLLPAIALAWPLLCRLGPRRLGVTASGALLVGLSLAALSRALARPTLTAGDIGRLGEAELIAELSTLRELASRLPKGPAPPLATAAAVVCPAAPDATPLTLVAAFVERERRQPALKCFQGPELRSVVLALRAELEAHAVRGPLELELLSASRPLSSRHGWLDAFKLRPGLDGACSGGSCIMPWQLLFAGAFSTYRPLAFIPDLQFGVDIDQLRQLVGASEPGGARLTRVTTRSFALDLAAQKPSLVPLARMRRREVPLRQRTLDRAERDAEAYVLGAQQPDGRFRYTLDPMTGQADTAGFNLARQAGTTLVLCELGRSKRVRSAIGRSVGAFSPFVRAHGELSALTSDPAASVARLGESALPLVSMLACAERTRSPLAPAAAGLARFLLRLQRPDGGFAPGLDLGSGEQVVGPEPLYAPGQAVLALILLEQRLRAGSGAGLPPIEQVQAAVERAMSYYSERYWRHPLRDFFFLEENWHCLAARAALDVHRHAGYEQLCIDYVRFKSRLILDARDGVDPDFDGGFGFGTLVPPHNTGAAGFGEALAAALPILRHRGVATDAEQLLLTRVLRFLLRQQWSQANCFACATPAVIGGMSEHTHSAVTRIDFAQHAWAALGHGRRALDPPP